MSDATGKTAPRTVLGFDFGGKRIGVAVGQELTASTQSLATVAVINGKPDWPHISRLLEQWQPALIIVGLPLNMDGSEQEVTRAARRFGHRLSGRYNLPVEMVDERLTSYEAEEILTEQRRAGQRRKHSRKAAIDQMAAELIIKTWFSQ